MAYHRQQTFLWPATMDVSVAATHWAKRGPQIRAHGIQDRFAKGQPSSSVTNQWGENISFTQRQAHRGTERFLSPAQKNPAMDFAHAIQTGEFVIQNARQKHDAIRFNVRITL